MGDYFSDPTDEGLQNLDLYAPENQGVLDDYGNDITDSTNIYDQFRQFQDPYTVSPQAPDETGLIDPSVFPASDPGLTGAPPPRRSPVTGVSMMPERTMSSGQALGAALASALPLILGATSKKPGSKQAIGAGLLAGGKTALDTINDQNKLLTQRDIYNQRAETTQAVQEQKSQDAQKKAEDALKLSDIKRQQGLEDFKTKADYNASLRPKTGNENSYTKFKSETAEGSEAVAALRQSYINRQKTIDPKFDENTVPKSVTRDDMKQLFSNQTADYTQYRADNKRDSALTDAKMYGVVNLNNLDADPATGRYQLNQLSPEQRKNAIKANTDFPQLFREAANLQALLDEKTTGVPQDATIGDTPKAAAIIQKREQALNQLITIVKQARGMGANFTQYEQRLVQGMLGVAAPKNATIDDVMEAWRKGELQGQNFQQGIKNFLDTSADYYFDILKANSATLDPRIAKKDPAMGSFIKTLSNYGSAKSQLANTYSRLKANPLFSDGE